MDKVYTDKDTDDKVFRDESKVVDCPVVKDTCDNDEKPSNHDMNVVRDTVEQQIKTIQDDDGISDLFIWILRVTMFGVTPFVGLYFLLDIDFILAAGLSWFFYTFTTGRLFR